MKRTALTTATAAVLLAALTACSSETAAMDGAGKPAAPAAQAKPLTASGAFTRLSARVTPAKLSGTVTAANDPDHLLGRPGQYTSKVTFSDSRIKAADVEYTHKGDVERGGEVEVFGNPTDAEARAKYIRAVTKSMPALAEYDYVHGTVLVRVSHYLTPQQAAVYKAALNGLS
ncbi:hypothetical protein ACGFX8_30325 [Streptomyces sp. NPDC048362]|uniref:hypothetical protein n=1 Tax=Streptomyces sp. NPDC048362 TaxID=3365539 RepID=UPI0037100000